MMSSYTQVEYGKYGLNNNNNNSIQNLVEVVIFTIYSLIKLTAKAMEWPYESSLILYVNLPRLIDGSSVA